MDNLCGCRKARRVLGIDDGLEDYDAFFTAEPGGGGGGRGGVRPGLCPNEAITSTQWSYVGRGRGGYEKVETFNFVGDGHGDFQKEMQAAAAPAHRRDTRVAAVRNCCLIFIVLAVLVAGIYKVAFSPEEDGLGPRPGPLRPQSSEATASTSGGFSLGAVGPWLGGHLPTTRSPADSHQESVSIPRLPSYPTTHWPSFPTLRPGFSCTVDPPSSHEDRDAEHLDGTPALARGRYVTPKPLPGSSPELWSPEHREWCCEKEGIACKSPTAQEGEEERPGIVVAPYTCSIGDVAMWPDSKASYCCEREGLGCAFHKPTSSGSGSTSSTSSTSSTTTTVTKRITYDCRAGFNNWENDWADGKKAWCCQQYSRGCTTTRTSTTTYSCVAGAERLAGLQLHWTVARNLWCCQHFHVGCIHSNSTASTTALTTSTRSTTSTTTPTSTSTTTTTTTTTTTGRATTSIPTTDRATTSTRTTGRATTSTTRRTTTAGAQAPAKEPAPATAAAAAAATASGALAATTTSFSSSAQGTSAAETTASSAETTEPVEFDCVNTLTDYEWSEAKQAYCCREEDICVRAAADEDEKAGVADTTFDCSAGFKLWKVGWSASKKEWCCVHKGKGCEGTARNFNCDTRREAWTVEKRAWCCEHESMGCSQAVAAA